VRGMDDAAFRMKNGDKVLIRKRDAKAVKDAYTRYFWNRIRGDL